MSDPDYCPWGCGMFVGSCECEFPRPGILPSDRDELIELCYNRPVLVADSILGESGAAESVASASRPYCDFCRVRLGSLDCNHVYANSGEVTMSRSAWERLVEAMSTLRNIQGMMEEE